MRTTLKQDGTAEILIRTIKGHRTKSIVCEQFVLFLNNVAIGNCFLYKAKNSLFLWRFNVEPDYQNQGYAQEMLTHVIEYAKTFTKKIRLYVRLSNENAFHIYHKFGFETTVVEKDFCQMCQEYGGKYKRKNCGACRSRGLPRVEMVLEL